MAEDKVASKASDYRRCEHRLFINPVTKDKGRDTTKTALKLKFSVMHEILNSTPLTVPSKASASIYDGDKLRDIVFNSKRIHILLANQKPLLFSCKQFSEESGERAACTKPSRHCATNGLHTIPGTFALEYIRMTVIIYYSCRQLFLPKYHAKIVAKALTM